MREFGKSEIFRYKCPICGSVNKRMIPIILGRSLTAVFDDPKCIDKYILQCCNCGHQDTFVRPGIQRPVICECQQEAPIQNQKCYALNKCELTQCPLYGTYTADKNSGYDDEQGRMMITKQTTMVPITVVVFQTVAVEQIVTAKTILEYMPIAI